jgi:hypothetical protein
MAPTGLVAHEVNEEDGGADSVLPVPALANKSAPQNVGIDDVRQGFFHRSPRDRIRCNPFCRGRKMDRNDGDMSAQFVVH